MWVPKPELGNQKQNSPRSQAPAWEPEIRLELTDENQECFHTECGAFLLPGYAALHCSIQRVSEVEVVVPQFNRAPFES